MSATIVPGLGAASRSLVLQLPMLSQKFPEIAGCHPGTINLRFEQPLAVTRPDHRSAPLAWVPGHPSTEVFDLVRIELQLPHGRASEPAWLYVAHRSPHRQNPCVHEVIAARQDLHGISRCRIRVASAAVTVGHALTGLPKLTARAGNTQPLASAMLK